MGRASTVYLEPTAAGHGLRSQQRPGAVQKFILLRVVSSPTSCSIDFSQWINYQRPFQTALRWTEGKMMFSFQ